MNIPFHKPLNQPISNDLINDSLKKGWLTTGEKVSRFENELSNIVGANHVICLNSATAALHLGLLASGIKPGEKFIAPTYTFVSSVEIGEYMNAIPVLVDSDRETFNMDLNQIEDLLRNNDIKCVIPVHFAGQSVRMSDLKQLSEKYGFFILDDAAHALETISDIGKIGNTNNASAFSFYANKNITTGGEGGALSTNDANIAKKVRQMSLHGMNKDGWKRFSLGGKWNYDIARLGFKYNMTDISASFGIGQLQKLNEWSKKRQDIVKIYNNKFSKIEGIVTPKHIDGKKHAWHLYIIKLINSSWKIDRDQVILKLNEKGIGTSVHYTPIHLHSYYAKKYNYKPDDYPNSYHLSKSVISLPLYPALSDKAIDYIINSFFDIWHKYKND